MVAPITPRQTSQDARAAMARVEAALTDLKTPGSVAMSPSPTKFHPPFLTKDSNMRGFTAWDVDERLHEVESQFKAMKEVVNGSLNDRKALEEIADLAKKRSTSHPVALAGRHC